MSLYYEHIFRSIAPPISAPAAPYWCPVCRTEFAVPEPCEPPRCDICAEPMEAL